MGFAEEMPQADDADEEKDQTRWWQGAGITTGAGEPQMGPDVGVWKSHCAPSAEPSPYLKSCRFSAKSVLLSSQDHPEYFELLQVFLMVPLRNSVCSFLN